jgi:mono/diheme cytochrome c family protein
MIRRCFVGLLVAVASASCHRAAPEPPADPMLEALRAEEQVAGLTYAQGQGRHLFNHYCAACHGEGGAGDGQNASNLSPPPPDLTTSKSVADAAYTRRVITEGSAAVGRSPLSPPWGRSLSRQQIEYLSLYCQALGAKGAAGARAASPRGAGAPRP